MMEVQKYVKENGFKALADEFGILIREYPDKGIMVLNYSQIDSPKTHPITRECRGLTLDIDANVITRSFDRFFNAGEADCVDFQLDPKTDVVHEKMDGSLIRCYNVGGLWFFGTRGTAFGEGQTATGDTFYELVMRVYGGLDHENDFQRLAGEHLNPELTYSLEFTSAENRVVTRYEGYSLHLLAARNNKTGEYVKVPSDVISAMKWKLPKQYTFDTIEACLTAAKELPDLQEGYVVYRSGVPVCKIKSPVYVATHLIRGEGLNPRRMTELVFTNEYEEYLSYYPEDRHIIQPYIDAYDAVLEDIINLWDSSKWIENQKEFALAVKDSPVSGVLFFIRKSHKRSAMTEFLDNMSTNGKMSLLKQYMDRENV